MIYLHNLRKFLFTPLLLLASCAQINDNKNKRNNSPMSNEKNPEVYFEIPVTNMQRAIQFYTAVFNFSFEKQVIDNYEMALFPFHDKSSGITGALAKGEVYKPTIIGVIIYFSTTNIDATLNLATANGGKILYPKTSNGDFGFVAEFEDSEGNRIALHQTLK